ncbi:MAG TPA: hypothetical protein VFI30_01415 [Nocardioidaceae bacterium]|nr:hypothetical protein [Nocardioidaceae bacterium]
MFDTANRGVPALFGPSGPAVELDSDETLDADETLQAARAAQRSAHAAEVRLVELAAHWADLHAVLEPVASGVLPGCERLVDLGGEGTPAVCEFAPTELGCELGLSGYAAERLVADALDLRHRLPRVWARTRIGGFPVWIARRIARLTRFHHRLKTHGRWQVAQPFDGILVWRSPHGHHYLVDHTGTQRLN